MLAVSVRSPLSEVVFLSLVNVLFVMRANFFVIVFIHFNPYAEIVSEGFAVLFAANFADRLFGTSRFTASAFFGFTLMFAVSLTYLGMRSVAARHPLVVVVVFVDFAVLAAADVANRLSDTDRLAAAASLFFVI